jgi:hypothetical protein
MIILKLPLENKDLMVFSRHSSIFIDPMSLFGATLAACYLFSIICIFTLNYIMQLFACFNVLTIHTFTILRTEDIASSMFGVAQRTFAII